MFKNFAVSTLLLLLTTTTSLLSPSSSTTTSSSSRQLPPLLDEPQIIWTNQVAAGGASSSTPTGMMKGNGAFLTHDQGQVITTSIGGTVSSFDSIVGNLIWDYQPQSDLLLGGTSSQITCHSNAVFTTTTSSSNNNNADDNNPYYMVYTIIENENRPLISTTRVIALDMDGNFLWISDPLEGIAAGSPVISNDGKYVFLTHNTDMKTIGYFTILESAQNGTTFFSMNNGGAMSINETSAPFSEIGIYHNPIEGYYDGTNGINNRNDILLWANSIPMNAQSVGTGSTYAFQFPVGFDDSADSISIIGGGQGGGYIKLNDQGPPRNFRAEVAPVITNNGRSSYWSVSRSGYVAWVGGSDGLPRDNFSRNAHGKNGGERNDDISWGPVLSSVALSSSTIEPYVFGGSAATEFVRFNYDLSMKNSTMVNSLILAKAIVDPQDRVVYYIEESGLLHQIGFDDESLEDIWTFNIGHTVQGEMSLMDHGSILYVTDSRGVITAIQVGGHDTIVAIGDDDDDDDETTCGELLDSCENDTDCCDANNMICLEKTITLIGGQTPVKLCVYPGPTTTTTTPNNSNCTCTTCDDP